MDFGWKFHLGDIPLPEGHCLADYVKTASGNMPAVLKDYDDSNWINVDLPHDFVIAGNIQPPDIILGQRQRRQLLIDMDMKAHMHAGHGSLPGGIGWYRKSFYIPNELEGQRIILEFDGVFRNSSLWLNRHLLGGQSSGYVPFRLDITDQLNYGEENLLAVRVDAREYEGWWYEGGGIYRHVWLTTSDTLHLVPDGIHVRCLFENDDYDHVKIRINSEVGNRADSTESAVLESVVIDPDGREIGRAESSLIALPEDIIVAEHSMELIQPTLWSDIEPKMHKLVTRIRRMDGSLADEVETHFGIRNIRFDAEQGFIINGRQLKIKGVCCHQDHAGVGVAVPDKLLEYRIGLLKDMGCNAYRMAHHTPSPELLQICDKLGMFVMAENRLLSNVPEIREDLTAMIRRYRNHPSVVIWSLGNEEMDIQGNVTGERITRSLRRLVKTLDPDRPVTLAMNGDWGQGATHAVDVQSCNYYRLGDVDSLHRQMPNLPIVISEATCATTTRGVYNNDLVRGWADAYGEQLPFWGHTPEENWKMTMERPFVAGAFIWTGFDYHGEPAPYIWAGYVSNFGIMDLCGFPKDSYYYYLAWWSDKKVLHVFPHWNWPGQEGKPIDIKCYSNCASVELFLNGSSLGIQQMPPWGQLNWNVTYQPGELVAKGYDSDGREELVAKIKTTNAPASIRMTSNCDYIHSDCEDVVVIQVEVIDAAGHIVPDADSDIVFYIEGPGVVIGVGNGDPYTSERDKFYTEGIGEMISHWPKPVPAVDAQRTARRRVFKGLCQLILQATAESGLIRIMANSPGLPSAEIHIMADQADCRQWEVT